MYISTSYASTTYDSLDSISKKIKHAYDSSWKDDVHESFSSPIQDFNKKLDAATRNAGELQHISSEASNLNANAVSGAISELASQISSFGV